MSSPKPNILIVLTSHGEISPGKDSGWFLSEFAHAYNYFAPLANITVASPKGGEAPLSRHSIPMSPDDESQAFLRDQAHLWKSTAKISDFHGRAKDFDAVYYPGGYGPMFDLATDSDSLRLLQEFAMEDKVISAVCHGPAALIHATLGDGTPLLAGCQVNAFPKRDDKIYGEPGILPFSLEDELQRVSGGGFQMSEQPLGEMVVVAREGRLVTGQNPASVVGLARKVMEGIGGRRVRA